MRRSFTLTKRDMVKVILTALYNRDHTLTDEEITNHHVWYKRFNRLMRLQKCDLTSHYNTALKVINGRLKPSEASFEIG